MSSTKEAFAYIDLYGPCMLLKTVSFVRRLVSILGLTYVIAPGSHLSISGANVISITISTREKKQV